MQAAMQRITMGMVSEGPPATASSGNVTPLDSFPAAAEILGDRRLAQITWALVVLGLVVRSIRYLLRFPLWTDEAFLVHNYLDRGYWELLQPLDFCQVAPLLYLWVQETFVKLFGFSEYSLRLYAYLCGIGSLLLFRHLASRLLRGTALVLAVGTFAVAYPLIRYSAEAKPYGSDMFVSLVLLTLAVEWWRRPQDRCWWWALTLAVPSAIMLSYPALFVAGGVSIFMATVLWEPGSRRRWLQWGLTNLALCAGALALFACSAGGQMASAGGAMRSCWSETFPPLTAPAKLAVFLLGSHSSDAMSYPVAGFGILTSLCCGIALVRLFRCRQFPLAVLCLAPLAWNFAAAAVHCYPYGGHPRLVLYMAPIFCLLTGLGAARLTAALGQRRWPASAPVSCLLALLVVIGIGCSVRDFLKPYQAPWWVYNRDFARWFWSDKAIDAELVCLRNDFGRRFYWPQEGDHLASVYFCNQRIYSARHVRREPAHLHQVSATRPLRCVRFRPTCTTASDDAAFRAWLQGMQVRYQLVAEEKYPMSFCLDGQLACVNSVEVYEFIPAATQETDVPAPASGRRNTGLQRR
jgi:4-amino-4-deoxy-L-arabinose transferase-like glycosyltransferase